jgi:peptidoglycan/xylan/chitin deacetylase (PgdA/CDA1 family)
MKNPSTLLRRIGAGAARRVLGTVTRVQTSEPVAALTFDDGPHLRFTPMVLDLLERHGARGTFFMIGEHAARHPEILRRMAESGHAIGNHSWDHPAFSLIGGRERIAQVRACAKATEPHGVRLFRPPYGEQSLRSRLELLALGYEVILFDCEVGDWCETDADLMARRLIAGTRPGSIVALHDALRWHPSKDRVPRHSAPATVDRGPMLAALKTFLEATEGRIRFVTVPELLGRGRPERENWYQSREAGGYRPEPEVLFSRTG